MSALSLFSDRVASHPTQVALRHHQLGIWRPVTWGELGERATRIAAGLTSIGVSSGDRVVLLMANHPAWLAADMAIQSIGAVCVAVDPDHSAAEVCDQVESCGARVVLCGDQEQFDKIDESAATGRVPAVAKRVVLDTRGMRSPDGLRADRSTTLSFDELESLSGNSSWSRPSEPDPAALAVISDGRTFTHAQLTAAAAHAGSVLGLKASDRILATTSFADPIERSVSLTGLFTHGFLLAIGEGGALGRSEMTQVQPTLLHAPDGWIDRVGADLDKSMSTADPLNRFALGRGWRPTDPSADVKSPGVSVLAAIGVATVLAMIAWLWLTHAWSDPRRIFGLLGIALIAGLVAILQGSAVTSPLRRQLGMRRIRAVVGTSRAGGARALGALNIPLIDPARLLPDPQGSSR